MGEGVIVGGIVLVGVIVDTKVDSTREVRDPATIPSSPIKFTDGFSSWDGTQADKNNNNKMTETIILLTRIKILAGDESMH